MTLDANGEIVPTTSNGSAARCSTNVRTVLEEAGSSWDRIVDVTVFLTDMERDFATLNRLYAEAFADNRPTRDHRGSEPAADSHRHRAQSHRDDLSTARTGLASNPSSRSGSAISS